MKELLEKLTTIEREVSADKGDFRLFALFLREDSPDKWDLLVSAPWADDDPPGASDYLARLVQSRLETDELLSLSRIVVLPPGNPSLMALVRTIHVQHGRVETRESNFSGIQIRHAYIVTANAEAARDPQIA
jgi:hypothetical protein